MRRLLPLEIGFLTVVLAGAGCNSTTNSDVSLPNQNLRMIGQAYTQATDKLNRGPANLQELMPYLEKLGDPTNILRSANDGEEFVILWKVDYRTAENGANPPVTAYEKKGRNGKRQVLKVRSIFQMTDEDFKQAPFPAGHTPPN